MGTNEAGTLAAIKALQTDFIDGKDCGAPRTNRQTDGRWNAGGVPERGERGRLRTEVQARNA